MINFYSNEIKIRIVRFLFVGILINILVALIYFTLIFLNFGSILSLTVSYTFGVISSIFINKNFTFEFRTPSLTIWYQFAIIHLSCFILSQITNETTLFLLNHYEFKHVVGFILSIGLAATINFICMNLVIKNLQKK